MKANLFFCVILMVVSGCQSNQQNKLKSADPISIISISEARKLLPGSVVTIQGTITVASGTFSSSTPYGYALQDSTAGIYIIDSIQPMEGEYKLGDLVKVTGVIEEINNLLAIRETKATKTGTGNVITPIHVNSGNVNESHEGMIVRTGGIIESLHSDLPYGYKIYINDGTGLLNIFVNTSAGFLGDTILWRISDSISVTGFSAQYGAEYEVEPVMRQDISVLLKN
jgi:DNA/RNA endonuclease YhcR with UshA esterase domain